MNGTFDPITLIFLVLAVVIFLRLRSVLGRRTGHERPPFDYSAPVDGQKRTTPNNQDNVIPLPGARDQEKSQDSLNPEDDIADRIKGHAPEGSVLEENLKAVARRDRSFHAGQFLDGAKMAYEMIVMAFSEGNKKTLKPLLSDEVYLGFSDEISAREKRGEIMDSSFVGINKSNIIEAELKGNEASITIKFVSEMITAIRDKAGEVISGDPKKIVEVTDIWTFARDITSRDPNWKLIGTESAN